MINIDRLTSEFIRLVSIDSVSFNERKMADRLIKAFGELGIELSEDNTGELYGGNTGNLYGSVKGSIEGEPVLFSAHMDTVEPGIGKNALLNDDGTITSDGTTVLGADDAAGLAAILEAMRTIKEKGIEHRDIELLFSIAEEKYIKGTAAFNFSKIKSKQAYVLDLSGRIGTAALSAPTLISFCAEFTGKAAHAGFEPENGINAICAAAKAAASVKVGRYEDGSTLNIGIINGGTATNIVAERCSLSGEIRSLEHKKALAMLTESEKCFKAAASEYGAELKMNYSIDLTAYRTDESSKTVSAYDTVCKELGIKPEHISTFGGSDNNSFALNGIEGIVIACGMNSVHSCDEYTCVDDIAKCAQIVLRLMIHNVDNEKSADLSNSRV